MKSFNAKRGLLVSVILLALSMCLSSLVLHDFGQVEINYATTVTQPLNASLQLKVFRPHHATKETPAPAVIFAHGLSTNKESYTPYALELSRRGFVVIAPDLLNHGDSDVTQEGSFFAPHQVTEAFGAFAAVRFASELDFVDSERMGIAGHSIGGNAVNGSVRLDDELGLNLLSAAYFISSDPYVLDEEQHFIDGYGMRDVGCFYTRYDHVFFKTFKEGAPPTSAQAWLTTDNAKAFVGFGDPQAVESVVPGHIYTKTKDGKTVVRVIHASPQQHNQPQAGTAAIAALLDFFQNSFAAPNYLPGANQVWRWQSYLSMAALFFLFASLVYLIGVLNETSFFKEIAPAKGVRTLRPRPDKKGRIWFWALTVLNCLFAFFSISMLFKTGYGYYVLPWLPQQMTNIYAPWGMLNGLFMLVTSFASYHLYAKKNGSTLESWGVKLSLKKLLKSLLMAAIALAVMAGVSMIAHHLCKMDFRYYLWGLRTLPPHLFTVFLTYWPMYLLFGISVSIAVNSAYFAKIWHEPPLVNDLFFALVNGIPAYVITTVGYHLFIKTGQMPNVFGSPFTFTFMVNAIPVFPLAVFAIRRLGRRTDNPYIPGIIVATVLCWMQVSSSFTAYVTMFGG